MSSSRPVSPLESPNSNPWASHHSPARDEPDAPLPIRSQYREDSSQLLAQSEPRSIDEDQEMAAESARPRFAWRAKLRTIWLINKGMFYVVLSQAFGASMNVAAQVLENESDMDPFQILFARMSITTIASYAYMWYTKVPAPLGTRPVLHLLLVRAVGGFFGVYGMYYSIQYLQLSEATVITFLAPIMASYACSFLVPGDTFSWHQQVASIVSLVGVVLIARPFRNRSPGDGDGNPNSADSYHHILATVVAFIGVFGAASAFTSIRMIGHRSHALVSVTWFSFITTVISLAAMMLPWIPFRLPSTALEWTLLTILGFCGFLLQYLLTAGLAYVPPSNISASGHGSRATQGVYSQLIFALLYDKIVWGATLSPMSWAGSLLILVCAIYVAMVQDAPASPKSEEPGSPVFKDSGDEEA